MRPAVHSQTVRYRMRQLDDLFGAQLHDTAAQFEMQLALRAMELRGDTVTSWTDVQL